jgi:hypothetical protein
MSLRPALILSAAIVAGCICLGLLLNQPSAGQQPAPAKQVGRYQAFAGGPAPGGGVRVIVCDTTTGECFVHWPEAKKGKGAWYRASPPRPTSAKAPKK